MKKPYTYIGLADKDYIRENCHRSNAFIARHIGCSVSTVAYQRSKLGLPTSQIRWGDTNVKRLADLLKKGCTIEQIADKFGTTADNIYSRIRIIRKQIKNQKQ